MIGQMFAQRGLETSTALLQSIDCLKQEPHSGFSSLWINRMVPWRSFDKNLFLQRGMQENVKVVDAGAQPQCLLLAVRCTIGCSYFEMVTQLDN